MNGRVWEYLEDIGPRVQDAANLALFLDFDGTLTPLIDDPDQVRLSPAVRQCLYGLSQRPDTVVAIVSGRELSDLQRRVAIPGIYCAGNHGLEISGPQRAFVEPTAVEHVGNLRRLTKCLSERLHTIPGARVENKGYTAAVHFRCVPESRTADLRRVVHATLANADHPFQLTTGNQVFDIRPRVHWTKGDAVTWIRKQTVPSALPIYLGDDTTDEDAFAKLVEGVTIKVGPGPQSRAQYFIEGPEQVLEFLEWLAAQRGAAGPAPIVAAGAKASR
jgi:trehalose-phosphatase